MIRWRVAAAILIAGCTSAADREESGRTGTPPGPRWLLLSPVENSPGPVFHENGVGGFPLNDSMSFGIDLFQVFGVTRRLRPRNVAVPAYPVPQPYDIGQAEILVLNREIRNRPRNPWLYERRARLRDEAGCPEEAREDFLHAQDLKARAWFPLRPPGLE